LNTALILSPALTDKGWLTYCQDSAPRLYSRPGGSPAAEIMSQFCVGFGANFQSEFKGFAYRLGHGAILAFLYWSIKIFMEVRTGRHCTFMLHAHLVFVTRYRKAALTQDMLASLRIYFEKVCTDFACELEEFNGEKDHVHLLIHYPPKVAVSKLVNSLKGVSSRRLKVDYAQEVSKVYWQGVLWSPSYYAGSVGTAPLAALKQYIERQQRPV
jgi:putative transposase